MKALVKYRTWQRAAHPLLDPYWEHNSKVVSVDDWEDLNIMFDGHVIEEIIELGA